MQRDVQPNEIDWVFCWRTSTGDVRRGARDTGMNGPVLYQPTGPPPGAGVRTIVRGRVRTCPRPPTGPRLDGQGGISRMCLFVRGYVTHASLVPARNERELVALRDLARAAVLSGDAREWALASIGARGGAQWALHISATHAAVAKLAERIDAPWTLRVEEKIVDMRFVGAQIFCLDRDGRITETLEADAILDREPLPAFAVSWRDGVKAEGAPEGRGVTDIQYPRPTGPDAWEQWVKAE